jgi:3-oxoacid CoA-transferase A subunit
VKDYGKVYENADAALADIPDGVVMAAHTWGFGGTPAHLFAAIARSRIKDITLLCPNFIPFGALEPVLPGPTTLLPKLKKVITPGIGGARSMGTDDKGFLDDYVRDGRLEIEVIPHGIWIERLHAAAMGLGGFYNPVGVGTSVETGKEKRIIDGVEYFLEKPIRPDVGIIKAHKADTFGNLTYYKASRGSHPIIAMASRLTIVEVDELVEEGEIDPEAIVTPGIYIDRIVRIEPGDVGSAKQKRDVMQFILGDAILKKVLLGVADKGGKQ